jgi:hypothetical protein
MRDYEPWVPRDATASRDSNRRDWALNIMDKAMAARTSDSGVDEIEAC